MPGADRFLSQLETPNAESLNNCVLLIVYCWLMICCCCCCCCCGCCQELDSDTAPSCSQSDERRRFSNSPSAPDLRLIEKIRYQLTCYGKFPTIKVWKTIPTGAIAAPPAACYVEWYFGNSQINWDCWNCCNVRLHPFCIGKNPSAAFLFLYEEEGWGRVTPELRTCQPYWLLIGVFNLRRKTSSSSSSSFTEMTRPTTHHSTPQHPKWEDRWKIPKCPH